MSLLKTKNRNLYIVTVTSFLLCLILLLMPNKPLKRGLSDFVNTLSGTGNGPDNYSHGHVHPLTKSKNLLN